MARLPSVTQEQCSYSPAPGMGCRKRARVNGKCLKHAQQTSTRPNVPVCIPARDIHTWVWTPDGDYVCKVCGKVDISSID